MLRVGDCGQAGIAPGDSIEFVRPRDLIQLRVPVPASNTGESLSFEEFNLLSVKCFFRGFTLRNINGDTQHAFRFAGRRVIEPSTGGNPAYGSIRSNDAELGDIRNPAFHGCRHSPPYHSTIVCVYAPTEVLHMARVSG